MLVITRKPGERIRVGDAEIIVVSSSKGRVTIGVKAPRDVPIVRGELKTRQAGVPAGSAPADQPADPAPTGPPS